MKFVTKLTIEIEVPEENKRELRELDYYDKIELCKSTFEDIERIIKDNIELMADGAELKIMGQTKLI
jgi:hypothetical protein